MAQISQSRIAELLHLCDHGSSNTIRGKACEDLICYLFSKIPGLAVTARDTLDYANSQEIDIAFWNDKLHFMPPVIIIECKNWASHVGSREIREFESKLRDRGLLFGIFVAINGITGNHTDLTSAHSVIAGALRDERRILVFTRDDIISIVTSADIIETIRRKLCELAVNRTSFN